MESSAVLKQKGMKVLAEHLGIVDAEKFITLIRRDSFDYTEWQRALFEDVPLGTFLESAAAYRSAGE
jgi:hypothetical protein